MALTQTENVTKEDIEAQKQKIKVMEANLELSELNENGLASFQESVSKATSIEEAYRTASNFKWKVEKIRRILSPPSEEGSSKKGRPRKH